MRKPTVLIDGRPIRKPISGVGQYVCNLTNELSKCSGCESITLTLEFLKSFPETDLLSNIAKIKHVSWLPRKGFNFLAEHLNAQISEKIVGNCDLLHQTFFGCLPVRKGVPIVSTIHDVIPIDYPNWVTRTNAAYSKMSFKKQLGHSSAIIAVSEYTKNRIVCLNPGLSPDKIFVVHNGANELHSLIDPGVFNSLIEKYKINRRYILYVGNIESRKGVATLVEAYNKLNLKNEFQLIIAGKKCWGYDDLDKILRQSDAGNIVLTGYISESEKASLLANADLFVYPSMYEGFGIPIVEAMKCGCPVISADNSSLTEVCSGVGKMFKTKCANSLAEQIEYVLGNSEERRRMSEAGLVHSKKYTWKRMAELTLDVYNKVL